MRASCLRKLGMGVAVVHIGCGRGGFRWCGGTLECMTERRINDLLAAQEGVIARFQAIECGLTPSQIRAIVHRREWAAVRPGIYVDHTGPLLWQQRAWSAVLDAWPAVLSHTSALRAVDASLDESGPIHVAVDIGRRVATRPGVVVHRVTGLVERALWNTSPPRVRVEDAVIDLAAEAHGPMRAVAVLADSVQARHTTADRLLATLERRNKVRGRPFLEMVLADVRAGSCSVLEHEYLTKVERAHRLPKPFRQAATTVGRWGFRDLEYPEWKLIIELDGRMAHESPAARDRDLERDLDAAVGADSTTLRLGWGQVFTRPCLTARKVSTALAGRGWRGTSAPCPRCPR